MIDLGSGRVLPTPLPIRDAESVYPYLPQALPTWRVEAVVLTDGPKRSIHAHH